jgi:molybdate transport repressor ModE-like protein
MKTGAVITAAGLSSRMNSIKPMLQLGGSSIIKTAITTLLAAGIQEIVVVTGNEAELLEKHISATGATCLYNSEYASKDMFYSVSIGLNYIQSRCDRVFLLPADTPLFSVQSLFVMLGYMDLNNCDILSPTNQGRPGHPILLKCTAIPALTDYECSSGLREAVSNYPGRKATVELDDIGLMLDADKPEDYERLDNYVRSETVKIPLSCRIKIDVRRRLTFFSDELCELLAMVDKHSSLHKACEEIGMAYSKGWKLVKIAEYQFGFPLLTCHIGGSLGGGSTLTDKCRSLIRDYGDLYNDITAYAEQAFGRYFDGYMTDSEPD